MQSAHSAWAWHIMACQPSPETVKNIIEAEHKLASAQVGAEKAGKDAEQSCVKAYLERVNKALSAHGLLHLDAAQAQFVASEVIARSD